MPKQQVVYKSVRRLSQLCQITLGIVLVCSFHTHFEMQQNPTPYALSKLWVSISLQKHSIVGRNVPGNVVIREVNAILRREEEIVYARGRSIQA